MSSCHIISCHVICNVRRMGNNFRMFCVFILPLLPITPLACNSSQLRGRQTFKFYYSGSDGQKGAYHLIPGPDNDDIDMSIVGCTNLDKSTWTMIDHHHHQHQKAVGRDDGDDGHCVILYREKDCQGHSLEEAVPDYDYALGIHHDDSDNDDVKSFHLCSWKGLSHSTATVQPETFQAPRYYRLFSSNTSLLAEYSDSEVKECRNLEASVDKRVAAVDTSEGCLYIYERRDCQGENRKLTNSWWNPYLKEVGWENRTSSVKACGLFLEAKITIFRPTSTLDDLEKEGELHKIDMGGSITFTNNGSNSTWRTYEEQYSFNETFLFERIEGLRSLNSVEVVNNVSLKGVMFPRLCFSVGLEETHCVSLREMKREIKKQLKNAYQVPSRNGNDRSWMAESPKNFSFKSRFEVAPCSRVELKPILLAKNITFQFELGVQLSGENEQGKRMTTDELWSHLPKGMNYSRDLDQFLIFAKVKGRILARLGIKPEVEIKTMRENIPGCGDGAIPQENSTSSTEMAAAVSSANPKESEAFKGRDTDTDISTEKTDSFSQNMGYFGLGLDNLFILIIIGMSLACIVLLICLIGLCSRRSSSYGRNGKECGILTVGGYVLTIECLCCPKCK